MSTYVKTYTEFKAKVIEVSGEDYYDEDHIQELYSFYTTKLYDADGVAKNNLAEWFFEYIKEAKEEVEAEAIDPKIEKQILIGHLRDTYDEGTFDELYLLSLSVEELHELVDALSIDEETA